jgi:hypothetical protein
MTTQQTYRNLKFWLLTGLTFLLPTMAFANAGSPMMWFGILHSLILNHCCPTKLK